GGGGGRPPITNLAHSQLNAEVTDLKSLAEMYNSQKFNWVHLVPGTERFALRRGAVGSFDPSSFTPDQSALFLGATATVAANGTKLRPLYVWESDTDRHVYVYTECGEVLASYPPPEDYDPYVLARKQIESRRDLSEERIEWLIKSLDPTRVVACVTVADGPLPAAPPLLQPEISPEAPLPGGFGILGFDPEEEPLSRNVATWVAGLGPRLTFQNPGKGSSIPIWRRNGPDFGAGYSYWKQMDNVPSDSAETTDESAVSLESRYYYTPFLDTTYVQAPSSSSLTVKYLAPRNVTHTARLWKPGGWGQALTWTASKASFGSGLYLYERTFSGLDADTTYKYAFTWTQDSAEQHTAVQTTRTWPEQEDIGEFSFIVYGDNRWANSDPTFNPDHRDVACLGILRGGRIFEGEVEGEYVNEYPAFVLHVGDLVYTGGDPLQWIPHFFRPAGSLLSRISVFPCIGNHDWDPNGLGVAKYTALFKLPSANERWYSFPYGNSYFIVLDTYSPYSSGAQYDWLVGTALPAAQPYDWVFVLFHCPPYTDSSSHQYNHSDVRGVRENLAEPRFENRGGSPLDNVNVVLSGHNHFYERSYRRSVQYVVTGGGGVPDQGMHDPGGGNPYRVYAEKVRHHCVVRVFANDLDDPVVTAYRNGGSVIESIVLPAGGRWRWYSQGQQPPDAGGHSWRDPEYDDSAWSYGPAELGYSDGEEQDEATTLPYGGNANNRWIAHYFRKRFYVANPGAFDALKLRLLRDDGAVAYVNGTEVVRSNMPGTPGNPVPYATLASEPVEGTWLNEIDISDAPVTTGWNCIAVQVHQVSQTSSDVSFDLEIVGRKPPE
ncbi:MAG: metallophosphoesterase, partial [bacterium]|nr:metallophosphoesterase [bacterium]